MVDGYNIGARNQHADSGAYEFHIHRAYIIYGVMHENHPNTQNLQQQSFNTLFTIYMTHLPSLVEFRGLVSEYWYCRIQTMVSPLKHRKLFFIAYRKLILNYAKAFITLYPWINSSVSPRALLGLVLSLLEE